MIVANILKAYVKYENNTKNSTHSLTTPEMFQLKMTR